MTKSLIYPLLGTLAIMINMNFAHADQLPTSSPPDQGAATSQANQIETESVRMKMVQKHLEHVKKALHITSDEEVTWQAYATKVTAKVKMMVAERDRMRQERRNTSITTPERMEDMAKSLNRRAAEMSEMADVTKTLYVKLTPQQRIQFDNIAQQETKKYYGMMQHNMVNHSIETSSVNAQSTVVPATK